MSQVTPPPTLPSPSVSLYDLSDDEEGEYNTIRHNRSGRGVKLLNSKSKVYVHPTPLAKDNIPGFIALLQQKDPTTAASSRTDPTSTSSDVGSPKLLQSAKPPSSSLLLAWAPESSLGDAYSTYVKVDLSDTASSTSPPKQSYLVPPLPTTTHSSAIGTYAFAIPVSEIYSLLVRPPSVGWWFGSLVINTRAGDSFPALFFHDSECQSTIQQRKKLARQSFDPFGDGGGMFWGGDEVLRWLKKYIPVERSPHDINIYLMEPSESDRLGLGMGSEKLNIAGDDHKKGAEASQHPERRRDGGMDPVTKAVKEARWNFLEKLSQVTTFTRRTAQLVADNPKMPPQVRRLMQNPEVQTLQGEFDSAKIYLARWAMGIAEQSEKERSQRIWTAKDVLEMEESAVGEFEILEIEAGKMSLRERRRPVNQNEWKEFSDPTGKLRVTVDEVTERIFHGGLNPEDGVREDAWLFLLGVYDWNSTREERQASTNRKREEYVRLKGAWWDRLAKDAEVGEEVEWWKEQRMRIGELCGDISVAVTEGCFRKRCSSNRSPRSPFCWRRHTSSRSGFPLCGSWHKCASGADERHAPYIQ